MQVSGCVSISPATARENKTWQQKTGDGNTRTGKDQVVRFFTLSRGGSRDFQRITSSHYSMETPASRNRTRVCTRNFRNIGFILQQKKKKKKSLMDMQLLSPVPAHPVLLLLIRITTAGAADSLCSDSRCLDGHQRPPKDPRERRQQADPPRRTPLREH